MALECYVRPVMLYGNETWAISKVIGKKLEDAEMWFLRKLLKIFLTENKTNKQIY